MNISDLFAILPDVAIYISSGYIFIVTFRFVAFKEKLRNINAILVLSLITGFILTHIFSSLMTIDFNKTTNIIPLFLLCSLAGISCGGLINCKAFQRILKKIHLGRSINQSIWNDIVDIDKKPMWIQVVNRERDQVVRGILVSVEEFERFPQFVLQQYQVLNLNGEMIEDNSQNAFCHILLKSIDFDEVDIRYDSTSKQIIKIKVAQDNEL